MKEPNLLLPVRRHWFLPDTDLSPAPANVTVAKMLEFADTEEEMKDWSESHYYQFVYEEHCKILAKRGLLDNRPKTPKAQKGMNFGAKSDLNLK